MTIKITLNINEQEKTFASGKISARKFRDALKFAVKEEEEQFANDLEMMDQLVELVASFFPQEEVNIDSIYDGLEADKFAETLQGLLMKVLGGQQDPGKHPANQ